MCTFLHHEGHAYTHQMVCSYTKYNHRPIVANDKFHATYCSKHTTVLTGTYDIVCFIIFVATFLSNVEVHFWCVTCFHKEDPIQSTALIFWRPICCPNNMLLTRSYDKKKQLCSGPKNVKFPGAGSVCVRSKWMLILPFFYYRILQSVSWIQYNISPCLYVPSIDNQYR